MLTESKTRNKNVILYFTKEENRLEGNNKKKTGEKGEKIERKQFLVKMWKNKRFVNESEFHDYIFFYAEMELYS